MSDEQVGQDEIEQLLKNAQQASGGDGGGGEVSESEAPTSSEAVQDVSLDQNEIEALMSGTAPAAPSTTAPAPIANLPPAAASSSPAAVDEAVSQGDVEFLLNQAQAAIASIDAPAELPPGIAPFSLNDFGGTPPSEEAATLELVRDVNLDLKIELGRTHMHLEDVLRLRRGAVVPLDKLAGDPVDLFVNGRLIARGEVLVLNDNFCVRVTELIVGDSAVA